MDTSPALLRSKAAPPPSQNAAAAAAGARGAQKRKAAEAGGGGGAEPLPAAPPAMRGADHGLVRPDLDGFPTQPSDSREGAEDEGDAEPASRRSAAASNRYRQKWSPDEERELARGVERHGMGKWKAILADGKGVFDANRTNVDLKARARSQGAAPPSS